MTTSTTPRSAQHDTPAAGARSGDGVHGTRPKAASDRSTLEYRLRVFGEAARWAALVLGLAVWLVAGPLNLRFITVACALVLYATLQHADPIIVGDPNQRTQLRVGLELALMLLAVGATGAGGSPFVLTPMTAMVLAGYVWGDRFVVASTGVAAAGIATTVAFHLGNGGVGSATELAVVFLMCAMLGSFGRSFVSEVQEQRAAVLDQASQMSRANELLVALHGLAQTLPASLDLGEVVASARNRLRTHVEFTTLVIFVRDDTGDRWLIELAEGVRMPISLPLDGLPAPLQRAATGVRPLVVDDLLTTGEKACAPLSRSGLYAPLRARGSIVGLLALEHTNPGAYGEREATLVSNASALVALAIDNAKWFARLRMFGAEAERARIARDLHDRIAQELAYVAFELERLRDRGGDEQGELSSLHEVVRSVVTGLRETLYQLRASVTEDTDLEHAAPEYLARFEERTGVAVTWKHHVEHRLPLPLEQEVWRILQEALTNVERHAGASTVDVRWQVIGTTARLDVRDDGRGFEPANVTGDHYGLIGIRERADAIRGRLTIDSKPGSGAHLSLQVEGQR
ncbi:MAG: sensor histidine kinase [Actinomycetia bacterium]|nr:sensor histidine kinase [Actinomycetes bacterium]